MHSETDTIFWTFHAVEENPHAGGEPACRRNLIAGDRGAGKERAGAPALHPFTRAYAITFVLKSANDLVGVSELMPFGMGSFSELMPFGMGSFSELMPFGMGSGMSSLCLLVWGRPKNHHLIFL